LLQLCKSCAINITPGDRNTLPILSSQVELFGLPPIISFTLEL